MPLFSQAKPAKYITVVSGLPRSGTSMMMKMLEAGGIAPITDNLRTADDDNPKGYYEFERVKQMKDGDLDWVREAPGKVVKVISALLEYLPDGYEYRVVFMRRKMAEILASQKKMLAARGEPTDRVSDAMLAGLYEKHLRQVEGWMAGKTNFKVLMVDYNAVVADPRLRLEPVVKYLDGRVKVEAMLEALDPALYRQRK